MKIKDAFDDLQVAVAERGHGFTYIGSFAGFGMAPVTPSSDRELDAMMDVFGWNVKDAIGQTFYVKGDTVMLKIPSSKRKTGYLMFAHDHDESLGMLIRWLDSPEQVYNFMARYLRMDRHSVMSMLRDGNIYGRDTSKVSTFLTDEVGIGTTVMQAGKPTVSIKRLGPVR